MAGAAWIGASHHYLVQQQRGEALKSLFLPRAALPWNAGEEMHKIKQSTSSGGLRATHADEFNDFSILLLSTLLHRVYKFSCCADDIILRIQADNVSI